MALKTVFFDFETIANPKMLEFLPPVEAKSGLKDPAKIEADIKEKKQKQLEKMGLDKTQCLICCASFLDFESGNVWSHMLNPQTLDETEILANIQESLHPFERFVGFNTREFDIPILTFRCMVSQVPMLVQIDQRKYVVGNHVDIRALLTNWEKYESGSMDYFCKIILGESKAGGMDGAMVQHFWDCAMYDEIKAYNQAEVRKLSELYRKIVGYYI